MASEAKRIVIIHGFASSLTGVITPSSNILNLEILTTRPDEPQHPVDSTVLRALSALPSLRSVTVDARSTPSDQPLWEKSCFTALTRL